MPLPRNLLPRLYRHLMLERCISDAGMQDYEESVDRLTEKYSDDKYGAGTVDELRRLSRIASCCATEILSRVRQELPTFSPQTEFVLLQDASEMVSRQTGLSSEDAFYACESLFVLVRFGFPGGI